MNLTFFLSITKLKRKVKSANESPADSNFNLSEYLAKCNKVVELLSETSKETAADNIENEDSDIYN